MENNSLTNTYYVVWEDNRTTGQVVRVSALTEIGAVALAAPSCKCADKSWVRTFTEEDLKKVFGKRRSCRCYSGDDLVNYIEQYSDKINVGSTQYINDTIEGVSNLLSTLLVYSYEHQCKCIIGSTKGLPSIHIKAYGYDVEYAEPYIE